MWKSNYPSAISVYRTASQEKQKSDVFTTDQTFADGKQPTHFRSDFKKSTSSSSSEQQNFENFASYQGANSQIKVSGRGNIWLGKWGNIFYTDGLQDGPIKHDMMPKNGTQNTSCYSSYEFESSCCTGTTRNKCLSNICLMYDNACPHTTNADRNFLQTNEIPTLPWSAQSADIISIKNTWSMLQRSLLRFNDDFETHVQDFNVLQEVLTT